MKFETFATYEITCVDGFSYVVSDEGDEGVKIAYVAINEQGEKEEINAIYVLRDACVPIAKALLNVVTKEMSPDA